MVGSGKSFAQLLSGKDLITGDPTPRWIEAVGIIVGIFGAAAVVKGILKGASSVLKHGDEVADVAEAVGKNVVLESPKTQFGKLRLSYEHYKKLGWPKGRIKSHLDGIDFTKEVKTVKLPKGKSTAQYQVPNGKKGAYFSEPNAKATELGINPKAEVNGVLVDKTKTTYKLNSDVVVLESKAKSGIMDTWSAPDKPFKTTGGGTQYFTTDNTVFVPKK